MKKDLVLGIDCSTSSCKAIIWNAEGKRVAEGRSGLSTLTPRPLWHEQPAESWWEATTQAIQQAAAQIDPLRLAALCITHQRETFVPVDEKGTPLRNAVLWMDERAGELLADLEAEFEAEEFHHITGKPFSGNLSLAKIAWLRKHEPEIFERTAKYLDVHAYLVYQLTGLYRTGWGCADPMGLFDMRKNRWAADLLSVLGLTLDQLPDAFPTGQIIGEVTKEAAEITNLRAGLPVVAGIGDGQAAGLGAGVAQAGMCCLSLGTSVVSGAFSPEYHVSDNFRTTYSGIAGSYLFETVILGGTYTIDWFIQQVLGLSAQEIGGEPISEEVLEAEASAVTPGASGLLVVPYWNSAMNPYWDAKASGVMVGLRGVHGRGHIYRAILEGIAFEQRLHSSGVESVLGAPIQGYITVGGGAKSGLWRQIIADISGKPVIRSLEGEAAALGAGILAACAVGLHPITRQAVQAMVHMAEEINQPDDTRHSYYSRLYEEVYYQVYPALRDKLERLTDLSQLF